LQEKISIGPGTRKFLVDLDAAKDNKAALLASACRTKIKQQSDREIIFSAEGIADTPGIVLLKMQHAPKSVTLDDKDIATFDYSANAGLLWLHFTNDASPHELRVKF
jgi:hypothetical protein